MKFIKEKMILNSNKCNNIITTFNLKNKKFRKSKSNFKNKETC